jgi:HEAT repeat protein
MHRLTPLQKRPILFAYLFGVIGLAAVPYLIGHHRETQAEEIESLIAQLRKPVNKVRLSGWIDNDEILEYSPPMNRLVAFGDAARESLHQRLNDAEIQNEVVAILGWIGDERTVKLLVQHYPDLQMLPEDPGAFELSPQKMKAVCFTCALEALTHEDFRRSKWETKYSPGNRKKWQDWWARNEKIFWVTDVATYETYTAKSRLPTRSLRPIPRVLSQLNKALTDPDPEVRRAAVWKFHQLGAGAKPSVPNLISALSDGDLGVCKETVRAFRWISAGAVEAIPALAETMKHHRDPEVRDDAGYALGEIGQKSVPSLLTALHDNDPKMRKRAALAIGWIKPPQKELIPELLLATKDEVPDVREWAINSLTSIDLNDVRTQTALRIGLRDESSIVRAGCAYACRGQAPAAEPFVKDLTPLLSDKDAGVRSNAIDALLRIGSVCREQIPLMMSLLKDKEWGVRSRTVEALYRLGAAAKVAVPDLRVTLRDVEPQVRSLSAMALGAIGPESRVALSDLTNALQDKDETVRRYAADAIKKINSSE